MAERRPTGPPRTQTPDARVSWGAILVQGSLGGAYAVLVASLGARRFGRDPRHDWMTVGSVLLRDEGIVAKPTAREITAGIAVRQGAELGWATLWWTGVLRGLDRPQQRRALLAAGVPWALGTTAVERWGILPWLRPMVKAEIPLFAGVTVHTLATLSYPVLFLLDPADDPEERRMDRRMAFGALGIMGGVLAGTAIAEGLRRAGGRRSHGTPGEQKVDERFVRKMVGHHEAGIELARLAAEKGQQTDLQTLGRQLEGEQLDERETLHSWWRDHFDEEVPGVSPNEARGTAGMLPRHEIERLRGLSGRSFELAMLPILINHHNGAIRLSEQVQREGKDPQVRALARRVAYIRKNQIPILERLLATARPVEEEAVHIRVTERLSAARGRTPRRTLTGRILDASRKLPVLLSPTRPRASRVDSGPRPETPARPSEGAPRRSRKAADNVNSVARTLVQLRRIQGPQKGDGRNDRQKGRPAADKA